MAEGRAYPRRLDGRQASKALSVFHGTQMGVEHAVVGGNNESRGKRGPLEFHGHSKHRSINTFKAGERGQDLEKPGLMPQV